MQALIRMPDVASGTGKSRETLYREIRRGLFPRPVKIAARMSAWPENEIAAVNAARIAGKSEDEIRELVARLERERRERVA